MARTGWYNKNKLGYSVKHESHRHSLAAKGIRSALPKGSKCVTICAGTSTPNFDMVAKGKRAVFLDKRTEKAYSDTYDRLYDLNSFRSGKFDSVIKTLEREVGSFGYEFKLNQKTQKFRLSKKTKNKTDMVSMDMRIKGWFKLSYGANKRAFRIDSATRGTDHHVHGMSMSLDDTHPKWLITIYKNNIQQKYRIFKNKKLAEKYAYDYVKKHPKG